MSKPYVIVFTTATIDGKIASKTRYSKLSCPEDLKRLHMARKEAGAVMIGANTANIDNPSLRLKYVDGPNPTRIVVDGRLSIREDLRLINELTARTIILTTVKADPEKVKRLTSKGVEVYLVDTERPPEINMVKALQLLYNLGIRKILVEGGGELIWSLIKHDLVDEFRVTYAGYVFGGKDAVSIVGGEGLQSIEESPIFNVDRIIKCVCGREVHVIFKKIPSKLKLQGD